MRRRRPGAVSQDTRENRQCHIVTLCGTLSGGPVLEVGPRENRVDLARLLARTDLSPEHLEAVSAWLAKQQGGNGQ